MVMQKNLSTAMNAKIIVSEGKETLILAHGYGLDQSVWEKVLPNLVENYQVLVFDWSFSGAIKDPNLFDSGKYTSYDAFADDLITIMDEMNLSSTIYVGHSMSGMIGCIASIKRPELFKKLVLVSASPRFKNSEDYEGGFEESDIEQLISNIEHNYEIWSTSFPTAVVDANDPPSIQMFEGCLKRMRPKVALDVAKVVFLSDERSILEKVVTPCTIIQTKKDLAVPNCVPKYMQSKINAESSIEIIDTEGHFPQLTAHVQFLDVLDKAINHQPI
ncbi:hypothetical protein Leryth_022199 [Lithospermum erythrorhizon]|uniref:Serine protease n=1 Tax=Lithospermum erythrorhizon TaxID=34254 RepID=A0AAV3PGE3_LITER|nr:hypothetical protein Leryth_022199 [Lithospermum erythrorhizon]